MKTRTAEVLCPLFFTKEQANTAMLKRLIETELHQFDVRGYAFASDAPESELEALFDVLRGAVAAHDVVLVRSHVERRPFRAEAWFYGKTQVKGYEFVVRAHADASKGQAEFFAASSAMRPVTGLLAELHRTFTAGARTRVPTLEVRPIFDERLRTPYADSRAVSRLVEAEAEPGDTGLAEA